MSFIPNTSTTIYNYLDADTLKEDFDLASISQGKWLTDVHINAAQKVLLNQFPVIAGFQNTVKSQNLSFNRIVGPYIQITHVNGNHWVTLEGVHGSLVRVYDSKYQSITESTQEIIFCMTMPDRNYIDVHIQNTQKQGGTFRLWTMQLPLQWSSALEITLQVSGRLH